jgi:hypothetical protein
MPTRTPTDMERILREMRDAYSIHNDMPTANEVQALTTQSLIDADRRVRTSSLRDPDEPQPPMQGLNGWLHMDVSTPINSIHGISVNATSVENQGSFPFFDASSLSTITAPAFPKQKHTEVDRQQSRAVINAFKSANLDAAQSMVRLGFELETQKSRGITYNMSTEEYDYNAWRAATKEIILSHVSNKIEYVQHLLRKHCPGILRPRYHQPYERGELIADLQSQFPFFTQVTVDEMAQTTNLFTTPNTQLLYEILQACLEKKNVSFPDRLEFTNSSRKEIAFRDMSDSGIEVGHDGSVQGFEFRTQGPQTIDEFITKVNKVFSMDHEINERCSFHIHISLPDVQHSYGPRLQAAMTEYLLCRIGEMPASLVSRWQGDLGYFKPQISREKYVFVNRHQRCGTWEFRCFGNITNAEDAKFCADMAIKALQHGYKVVAKEEELLKDKYNLSESEFYTHACEALGRSRNLDEYLAYLESKDLLSTEAA